MDLTLITFLMPTQKRGGEYGNCEKVLEEQTNRTSIGVALGPKKKREGEKGLKTHLHKGGPR